MDTSVINAAIQAAIKANGNNEITGPILQSTLLQIVAALNTGKNDTLVSGTNIKTIGGDSIVGDGNIAVSKKSPLIVVDDLRAIALSGGTAADVADYWFDENGNPLSVGEIQRIFSGEYDVLCFMDTDTGAEETFLRGCPLVQFESNIGGLVNTSIYRVADKYMTLRLDAGDYYISFAAI